MPPAVSIILPTFDRLPFLREAVQSVLRQTESDWELIVVDDGSTDESVKWLESLRDPRITIVREPHTGNRAALRNLGVERSSAQMIAFIDSDDRWHPEKLARQLALHRDNPNDRWSYTGYRFIDAAGTVLAMPATRKPWHARSGWIGEREIAVEANIALPSVFVERALFHEARGFDATFLYAEDQELWFRLAKLAECGVVDAPLIDIRLHRDTSVPDPELCLGYVRLYREFASRTSDSSLRETLRTTQAYKAIDAVGMLGALDRWSDARAALMIAMRLRPRSPFVYKAGLRLLARYLRTRASREAVPHSDGSPRQSTQRDR